MRSFRLFALAFILSSAFTVAQAQELDGEFVDLGLSVKWSTHNQFPTPNAVLGCYYNWKRATGAQPSTGARLPSQAEWQELIDNCVWKWTVRDSVNGYLLTSKVKGYEKNSIFIPAVGYWKNDHVEDMSVFGRYWTSTTVPLPGQYAYAVYFQQGNVRWVADKKDNGNSIRMVMPLTAKEVPDISFEKNRVTMRRYTSMRLNVTVSKKVRNVNNACKWTSDNESVVRIMDDGLLVAVRPGKSVIRVEAYGKSAECTVTVHKNDMEFVDMGVGVKWATCNIGADKPSDYGDYFAWGEIEPKKTYINSNYRYTTFASNFRDKIIKYDLVDKIIRVVNMEEDMDISDYTITLDPYDDVASVLSDRKWRMPTVQDFEELQKNSKIEDAVVNGVKGLRFTSTVPGYEANSIFIPFAGTMEMDVCSGRGKDALIWTSNPSKTDENPDLVNSAICVGSNITNELRYIGLPVRPVK